MFYKLIDFITKTKNWHYVSTGIVFAAIVAYSKWFWCHYVL